MQLLNQQRKVSRLKYPHDSIEMEDKLMEACRQEIPMTHDQYQRDKIRELQSEVQMWQNLCIAGWFFTSVLAVAFNYVLH